MLASRRSVLVAVVAVVEVKKQVEKPTRRRRAAATDRPKTDREYLAALRQFEPGINLSLSDVQERHIDDVLSTFIGPYVRDGRFPGSSTSREKFLRKAKAAIGRYIGQRNIELQFDRSRAKKLLVATSIAINEVTRQLNELVRWRELSNYLRRLHRNAARKVRQDPSLDVSESSLEDKLQDADDVDRIYFDFAPDQVAWRLVRLDAVVTLAAEKVTFGWGDAQRDQIAQAFTDELASAWMSATGKRPTCSRPTRRLKNPSPFARLLETINTEILEKDYRVKNNFLEYGIKSVRRIKNFQRNSVSDERPPK